MANRYAAIQKAASYSVDSEIFKACALEFWAVDAVNSFDDSHAQNIKCALTNGIEQNIIDAINSHKPV